jgi:hypothetical protein
MSNRSSYNPFLNQFLGANAAWARGPGSESNHPGEPLYLPPPSSDAARDFDMASLWDQPPWYQAPDEPPQLHIATPHVVLPPFRAKWPRPGFSSVRILSHEGYCQPEGHVLSLLGYVG